MPRRSREGLDATLLRAVAGGIIPPLTNHALRQALKREIAPHHIVAAIERGLRFRQSNGLRVFVLRLHGHGYFYLVLGRGGVITVSRKDLSRYELRRATIRYRWQPE